MEIYNFHTYRKKHTGPNYWEQKVVMKYKQENNRAKAVLPFQDTKIFISSMLGFLNRKVSFENSYWRD